MKRLLCLVVIAFVFSSAVTQGVKPQDQKPQPRDQEPLFPARKCPQKPLPWYKADAKCGWKSGISASRTSVQILDRPGWGHGTLWIKICMKLIKKEKDYRVSEGWPEALDPKKITPHEVCCDQWNQATQTKQPCDVLKDIDCDGIPNEADDSPVDPDFSLTRGDNETLYSGEITCDCDADGQDETRKAFESCGLPVASYPKSFRSRCEDWIRSSGYGYATDIVIQREGRAYLELLKCPALKCHREYALCEQQAKDEYDKCAFGKRMLGLPTDCLRNQIAANNKCKQKRDRCLKEIRKPSPSPQPLPTPTQTPPATGPTSLSTFGSTPSSSRNQANNTVTSSGASRIVTAKANVYFNQKRYAEAAEAHKEALCLQASF